MTTFCMASSSFHNSSLRQYEPVDYTVHVYRSNVWTTTTCFACLLAKHIHATLAIQGLRNETQWLPKYTQ